VLESARIMRRRRDEVNTRSRCAATFAIVAIVASLALASSCGGRERRAERLWRQALESAERGDHQGAVDRLQRLIDQYPDAEIASKAREQIIVYRGLANAVQTYPTRRARQLMVQVARAVEAYRRETGHLPATLSSLVPRQLPEVPPDPWDRPLAYETGPRGYRLRCDGADRAPGGTGDAADLLVVNGDFVSGSP